MLDVLLVHILVSIVYILASYKFLVSEFSVSCTFSVRKTQVLVSIMWILVTNLTI